MIVEVSFQRLNEGQPLFGDVYHLLKAYGFAYMDNLYQILNPKDGSTLQADALFVKP